MEAAAMKRWQDKMANEEKEEERVRCENVLIRKRAASDAAKALMSRLTNVTYTELSNTGHFPDAVREVVVSSFMPSLLANMVKKADTKATARAIVDAMLLGALELGERIGATAVAEELARIEARKEAKTGFVRLFVKGLGLNDDEDESTAIGPIPVVAGDTVNEVERKIREWLTEHYPDFTPPAEGFLKLSHGGKVLDDTVTLLDADVGNDSTLELLES